MNERTTNERTNERANEQTQASRAAAAGNARTGLWCCDGGSLKPSAHSTIH